MDAPASDAPQRAENNLPGVSIAVKYVNMADILSQTQSDQDNRAAHAGRDRLIACAELLFFAYRDFTAEADAVLDDYGFGRAHHRVLHFVYRNPGLRVARLLDILQITKQSLARVLKQLIDQGFIQQKTGPQDRRERQLFLTGQGSRLAEKLTNLQVNRLGQALAKAGPGAEDITRAFLLAMVTEDQRVDVAELTRLAGHKG